MDICRLHPPSGPPVPCWIFPSFVGRPFFGAQSMMVSPKRDGIGWSKMVTKQKMNGVSHYPLVICYSLLLNMAIELVDLPTDRKWWIFPVRYFSTLTRPGHLSLF